MKKLLVTLLLLAFSYNLSAGEIVGFWKTVNEKTKQTESIIAVYEFQNQYYGRIILTYDHDTGNFFDTMDNPISRAPGVIGNPFYSGMDIIWNLQRKGDRFTHGRILDPEHGRIYDAELWNDRGNLIVRGKLFFFGRNQTWPPAEDTDFPPDFKQPDLTKFVPVIPKVK